MQLIKAKPFQIWQKMKSTDFVYPGLKIGTIEKIERAVFLPFTFNF